MKAHWSIGCLLALLVVVLWSLSAAGQTEITVTGAKATYQPQFAQPAHGFVIQDRVTVNYGAARKESIIPALDVSLNSVLGTVTDRIIMLYAKSNRHYNLAYPKDLVNDQTPPALEGEFITRPAASDALTLTWTVNEFAVSTLHYGIAPNTYTASIVVSNFFTRTGVAVTGLAPGTIYYGRVEMVDVSGNPSQSQEFTFTLAEPPPPTGTPLVMIYAVLDNNLGDDSEALDRLITNIENGTRASATVRFLIDGPGNNDSYAYEIKPGLTPCIRLSNPTCSGRYVENVNFWRWDENTAHPKTLYDFVAAAVKAYPTASHNILSLVGHGSGWTANVIPGQPSQWTGQPSTAGEYEERVGGLLWDDTPGVGTGSRSMSTKALGIALGWIRQVTKRNIDLLYLDACSMGMAEVGYEVRQQVNYLLASPNMDWTSFAYDAMLPKVTANTQSVAIGQAWLAAEKAALNSRGSDHPYTLVLYDLSKLALLAQKMNSLSVALQSALSSQRNAILAAYTAVEHYESDYDGAILGDDDHYGDLGSFLQRLKVGTSDPTLTAAIQGAEAALQSVIVEPAFGNGAPYLYPGHLWQWLESKGLAIYLPGAQDPKFSLYTVDNVAWVQASAWRDFLSALWGTNTVQSAGVTELPTCTSTRNCKQLPAQLALERGSVVFLPLISR